jgi:hypothetical protein
VGLDGPQGEPFFEPPPLTAVQKEVSLGVLSALSVAGGEFIY